MRQTIPAQKATVHHLKRTDPEIVDGLREGDPSAARALVDKYGPSINARVWRMMGADPDHEDVVQQVLLAVLSSLSKLRDPQALQDWIGKITVNVVRNELRSRRVRRFIRPASDIPEEPPAGPDLESLVIARRGFAVLDRLAVEDRILFVMRFIEGAALDEIAAHTGHSVATVKRRLIKARDTFFKKARRDPDLVSMFAEGLTK